MAPRQSDPQFKIRIPPDLKARIEASAKFNGRSVSGEILQVLEQYFPPEPSIGELVDAIEMYLSFASNPDAPPYRKGLHEKLLELTEHLQAGLDFQHPMNPEVMSPEEVEDARSRKDTRDAQREIALASENNGVSTEHFRRFMQGAGLSWITFERLEAALEILEEKGFEASLNMLGLKSIEFQNIEEAQEVYREQLARLWNEAQE